MLRLSIIIPVFNIEEFLPECLESCLRQDISGEEYEILLVDDGSSDHSIEVAQKTYDSFSRQDKPNLRILPPKKELPVHGASVSRNRGVDDARGKYIWFVDGDDKIEPNCLSFLLATAEPQDLDFVRFGFYLWTEQSCNIAYQLRDIGIRKGWEIFRQFQRPIGVWSALWRREFLQQKGIRLLEGYVIEDEDFMPRAQYQAGDARILDKYCYYYRQRQNSVMRGKASPHKVKSYLAVCEALSDFKDKHVEEKDKPVFENIINFMFSQGLSVNTQCESPLPLSSFRASSCYPLKAHGRIKYLLINASLRLATLAFQCRNLLKTKR
ncbi:MAG: glycosyltransferase [Victivallales bacterium]|nr:glycosyltransferase [Victivallales bacterium]